VTEGAEVDLNIGEEEADLDIDLAPEEDDQDQGLGVEDLVQGAGIDTGVEAGIGRGEVEVEEGEAGAGVTKEEAGQNLQDGKIEVISRQFNLRRMKN